MSTEALKTALQELLDLHHQGRLIPLEGSEGYIGSIVEQGESALAAAPAGGAEPVAYLLLDQGCRAPDDCEDFERVVLPNEITPEELKRFQNAGRCSPLYAAPTAQPQPAELKRYEPIVVIDESRGRLTASGAAMEAKFDGRWIRYSDVFPALSKPTLLNGLTEQETAASASVAGLSGAQPEAPAEPSQDYLPQTWVTAVAKECGVTATRLAFLFDFAERIQRATRLATPAPAAQQPAVLTDAARDVLAERQRQINVEGWTPEHDDTTYSTEELAFAASCYATADEGDAPPAVWPFPWVWWKPKDRRRNLIKAGALIFAEIERLDRAALKAQGGSQ